MLDIGDDPYKTLVLHQYLDASDLPDQIKLEGYLYHINKLYLHNGEAVIVRRFLLNLFQNINAALSSINSTVTAIICVSRAYHFFDSNFQVGYLEVQGRERQYFQLQFINVEIDDVEDAIANINRDIRRFQRNHPFLRGKNLSK